MGAGIVTEFDMLRAAQDAAYWASVSAIAAWAIGAMGLILNAVAAYFVWRQLEANRRALVAASEAAAAATASSRPWLKIELPETGLAAQLSHGLNVFACEVICTNIGTTPAIGVSLDASAIEIEEIQELEGLLRLESNRMKTSRTNDAQRHIFPGESIKIVAQTYLPEFGRRRFVCVFQASYASAMGAVRHATPKVRVARIVDRAPSLRAPTGLHAELAALGGEEPKDVAFEEGLEGYLSPD